MDPAVVKLVNTQKVALALGAADEAVKRGLAAAVDMAGDATAASRLLDGMLRVDETCILFTADGLSDSKDVTMLTDRTVDAHAGTVASNAAIRYVLCFSEAIPIATDSHAAHLASRHRFAGDEQGGDAADALPRTLAHLVVDLRPSSLSMPNRTLSNIIHREDANMATVRSTADLLGRGVSGCDVDGGARAAAAWLSDVLAAIDQEYDRTIADIFAALRGTTTEARRRRPTSLSLSLIEAVLKRYTALGQLRDTLDDPSGPFLIVRDAGHDSALGGGGTDAQKALEQRQTGLRVAVERTRLEAWSLLPLLRPLTDLKLTDAARDQSLASVAADVAERAALSVLLAVSIAPRDGHLVNTAFFEQLLLPLLSADLVSQVEAFLDLGGGVFAPKEHVATTTPDVPAIDSELAPIVLSARVQTCFSDGVRTLARWVCALRRAVNMSLGNDLALHARHVRLQPANASASQAVLPGASHAGYARDRLTDLLCLTEKVKAEGCGLLPPPVMTLFGTIHRAATRFPMLSPHQYKNWNKFTDLMDRSFVLKYTSVDTTIEFNEDVMPVAPPPAISAHGRPATGDVGGGLADDEEKALLRSRVVTLGVELSDCRRLVKDMEGRVRVAEAATAAARSDADRMRQELEAVRAKLAPPPPAARTTPAAPEQPQEPHDPEQPQERTAATEAEQSPPQEQAASAM
jgi:hypothetical protein